MTNTRPETSDIGSLALWLEPHVATLPALGYVPGKSALRDLLYTELGMSQLAAEEALDALEGAGVLRYDGDPSDPGGPPGVWRLVEPAAPRYPSR